MTRRSVHFLLAFCCLFGIFLLAMQPAIGAERTNVVVTLLQADSDRPSMGRAALAETGTLVEADGKRWLEVQFKPLQMQGLLGYLGNVQTDGGEVFIVDRYDGVWDSWNDPVTGTDPLCRGVPYPKTVRLPLPTKDEPLEVQLYIPIMAALGNDSVAARIAYHLPEKEMAAAPAATKTIAADAVTQKSEKSAVENKKDPAAVKTTDKKVSANNKRLAANVVADGTYRVPVSLYHATQDKPSMGAKGLLDHAEAEVTDGRLRLYLATDVLQVGTLATSLAAVYTAQDGVYVRAEAGDFRLSVPTMARAARPAVFAADIEGFPTVLPVLVDPQVAMMGNEPLPARLMIDWSAKEPIKDTPLIDAMRNSANEAGTERLTLSSGGLVVEVPADAFQTIPDLLVTAVTGEALSKLQSKTGSGAKSSAWTVAFSEPLERIPEADVHDTMKLRHLIDPAPLMTLYFPKKSSAAELYRVDDSGSPKAVLLQADGDRWRADAVLPGTFLLTEETAGATAVAQKTMPLVALPAATKTAVKAPPKTMSVRPSVQSSSAVAPKRKATAKMQRTGRATGAAALQGTPTSATTAPETETVAPLKPLANDIAVDDETTAATAAPRENRSVVVAVFLLFFTLIAGSVAALWRTFPALQAEFDRCLYLKEFERKVQP